MKPSEQAELKKIVAGTMNDDAGSKEVAADLGKPYWTLMHECDSLVSQPGDAVTHKLGLITLISILDITLNALPFLSWLARRYGYLVVRQPQIRASEGALHEQMSRAAREFGDVADELLKITDPASKGGRALTDEEKIAFERQCQEAMTALAQLMELARKSPRSNVTPIRRPHHE